MKKGFTQEVGLELDLKEEQYFDQEIAGEGQKLF